MSIPSASSASMTLATGGSFRDPQTRIMASRFEEPAERCRCLIARAARTGEGNQAVARVEQKRSPFQTQHVGQAAGSCAHPRGTLPEYFITDHFDFVRPIGNLTSWFA